MRKQNTMKAKRVAALALCFVVTVLVVLSGYASGNEKDYTAWTKEDWDSASVEDKESCALLLAVEMIGIGNMARDAVEKYGVDIDMQKWVNIIDEAFSYNADTTIGDIIRIVKEAITMPDDEAEASAEASSYLAWGKADWENASEEERMECCKAMAQKMMNLSDDIIEAIDAATLKSGTTQMISGIDELYNSGQYDEYTIEDFIKMMQQ